MVFKGTFMKGLKELSKKKKGKKKYQLKEQYDQIIESGKHKTCG